MSNRYEVWSTVVPEEGEPYEQREDTRTDEKTARLDAELIGWVGHRRSWVKDVGEGK